MGRNKKNPSYDADRIFREYIDAVVAFYQSGQANGKKESIRSVADEFGTTNLKIRKILITAGVFQSEISKKVLALYSSGKTIMEIQTEMQLCRASVYSYLPYVKTIYNAKELSANAQRLQLYRKRKNAVSIFQSAARENRLTEQIVWNAITAFSGYPFYTSKGMKFCYSVHGGEMQVDRKKKSITRSSVLLFVQRAQEMYDAGEEITGPKKIGTFGASYLLPVFNRFWILDK
ncbi:MAG: hypothetical protein PHN80_10805 [Hespellia sp.]|nr:hypothetical protein [Hespellia sp.]